MDEHDVDRKAFKRVTAYVLLRDIRGHLLLVRGGPGNWTLPGGTAGAGESPHAAAARHAHDLGIGLTLSRVLCMDWVAHEGTWGDGLSFIFDGGVLRGSAPARGELFERAEALKNLPPEVRRGTANALDAVRGGGPRYLSEGCLL